MKHTPLHQAHRAHSAKMVDFAGWDMPIQYTGVLDEYHAVRHQAGLFDVSHMGRIMVGGEGALPFLQWVTTNNVAGLGIMRAHYSMICHDRGGIKDDVFLYRLGMNEFLVCVNASNHEKILGWLLAQQRERPESVTIRDDSDTMAQLAIQGPASQSLLRETVGQNLDGLPVRGCLRTTVFGVPLLLARTGYTGELGYELYVDADKALDLWNTLIAEGKPFGLKPAGLGARDLLRLDMGYLLYGNDITEDTTPVEAGAEWVVDWEKPDFVGASVLRDQKAHGTLRRLIAFELLQKAVPRQGMRIYDDSQEIGQVTSGNLSPILQKGIGLGYVVPASSTIGTALQIDIRGRRIPGVVVKPPFYRRHK